MTKLKSSSDLVSAQAGPPSLSQQIEARIRAERNGHRSSIACLEAIIAACKILETNRIGITIAQVGSLTATRAREEGRIKAQSIRNNSDFAGYVRARGAEQALANQKENPAARVSFKTGDATTDGYIQTLEGELKQTRAQIKNLRSVIPKLGEYDLKSALEKGKLVLFESGQATIPAMVVDAIRTILDPNILRKVGLEAVPTGQIAAPDLANAILLSRAQVDALRKFVQNINPT